MEKLLEQLNYEYHHVYSFIGGVPDTINSFQKPVKKINDSLISSFTSELKGIEFIILYDNSDYSDQFKNRVFDFYVKCPLEHKEDDAKMALLNSIVLNIRIILNSLVNNH